MSPSHFLFLLLSADISNSRYQIGRINMPRGALLHHRSTSAVLKRCSALQVVKSAKDLPGEGGGLVIGSEKGDKAEQSSLRGKVAAGTRLYLRSNLLEAILKQDHTFGKAGGLTV